MRARLVLLSLSLGLVGACVALPRVTPEQLMRAQTRWPDATAQELEAGRQAYALKCSGCHSLHLPSEFTADEWHDEVEEMADKAKLSAADRERIERFLVATSKDSATAGR